MEFTNARNYRGFENGRVRKASVYAGFASSRLEFVARSLGLYMYVVCWPALRTPSIVYYNENSQADLLALEVCPVPTTLYLSLGWLTLGRLRIYIMGTRAGEQDANAFHS